MIELIFAFYSPCDYKLPKQHLATTLDWAAQLGVPVTLAQIIAPGQALQPVPAGVRNDIYETESVLFHKENLWNITARKSAADKLLFIDSDVYFSRGGVDTIAEMTAALDTYDVVQPFESAVWPDQNGLYTQVRKSAGFAVTRGFEPVPAYYHPGFAWGLTRAAFDRLGGFYDRHPFGGGDVAFVYSISSLWVGSKIPYYLPIESQYWTSPSYRKYQTNGTRLDLKVSYLPGNNAIHRWHGTTEDRQYVTRGKYFQIESGTEYPMHYRDDGILEWDDPACSDHVRRYFKSRKEDG
jgi:hypothetical protein